MSRTYDLRAAERATVWLVGSQRSGSTWLLTLLAHHPRVVRMNEIGIGSHLGIFTADALGAPPPDTDQARATMFSSMRDRPDYFFSDRYEHVWRPALRRFLLTRLRAQILGADSPAPARERVLVIKEPIGSHAAEMILDALPASRLLVLLRDGRDVVDSMLDAMQPDAWLTRSFGHGRAIGSSERLDFLRVQSHRWLARTQAVMSAYAKHDPSRRLLVRYEDLRAETMPRLREILRWLELSLSDGELQDAVQRLAFESRPEEARGSGRFSRAATPGFWRQSLSQPEQDEANAIMGPTLAALGYPD